MGTRKKTEGLFLRGNIWHIDKQIRGERIRASTGTSDEREAERILMSLISSPSKWKQLVSGASYTLLDASERWILANQHLKAVDRDTQDLRFWCDCIGHLSLNEIHQATIEPHLEARRKQGISSNTAKRALSTLTRVLTAAHTIYRDEWHQPWLLHVPKFVMPSWSEPRKPYPISLEEQDCLLEALDGDLRDFVLLLIHTGLRDSELRQLKWEFELQEEQGCLVFQLPAEIAKNKRSRLVFCNAIARGVIERRRGATKVYIFETLAGQHRSRTSSGWGWRGARDRAVRLYEARHGSQAQEGFKRVRVHDMRHTFGERLRAAGVTVDTVGDLLGHRGRGVSALYCRAQNPELIDAVKCLEPPKSPQNPHNGNVLTFPNISEARKALKNRERW